MGGGDSPFTDVRLQVSVYSAVLLSVELVGGWVRGGGGGGGGQSVYRCPFTALCCFQSSWWVGGCVGEVGNNPFTGVRLLYFTSLVTDVCVINRYDLRLW